MWLVDANTILWRPECITNGKGQVDERLLKRCIWNTNHLKNFDIYVAK